MHRATPVNSSFRAFVAGGARATVNSIVDTTLMQEHASDFLSGESRKGIESPQNYGFTSVVAEATKDAIGNIIAQAETFINFMGGNRSFPVAGNMDDRRHRLHSLEPGDSAMHRGKDDKQQVHMTKDGTFATAPRDKTVRLQLIDEDSGSGGAQPGGPASGTPQASLMDASGGGAAGAGTSSGAGGQGGQKWGQKAIYQKGQKSFRYVDVTKDETRSSGTNVRHYLADGQGYFECNEDKNVYAGALKGKAQFAPVMTLKGPSKNVFGKIG